MYIYICIYIYYYARYFIMIQYSCYFLDKNDLSVNKYVFILHTTVLLANKYLLTNKYLLARNSDVK